MQDGVWRIGGSGLMRKPCRPALRIWDLEHGRQWVRDEHQGGRVRGGLRLVYPGLLGLAMRVAYNTGHHAQRFATRRPTLPHTGNRSWRSHQRKARTQSNCDRCLAHGIHAGMRGRRHLRKHERCDKYTANNASEGSSHDTVGIHLGFDKFPDYGESAGDGPTDRRG